jgi:hypothetical protein
LVTTEVISFEILKNLLSFLEIIDVLPTNMPFSSIQNPHLFYKHLILPFIAVTCQEDSINNYKIQIWPKAPGFLSGMNLKLDFLDINGLIFLHFLEGD